MAGNKTQAMKASISAFLKSVAFMKMKHALNNHEVGKNGGRYWD